jgi:hypothetical protein
VGNWGRYRLSDSPSHHPPIGDLIPHGTQASSSHGIRSSHSGPPSMKPWETRLGAAGCRKPGGAAKWVRRQVEMEGITQVSNQLRTGHGSPTASLVCYEQGNGRASRPGEPVCYEQGNGRASRPGEPQMTGIDSFTRLRRRGAIPRGPLPIPPARGCF